MALDYDRFRIRNLYGRIIVGELAGIYLATVIIYSSFLQYALGPAAQVHSYLGFTLAVGMAIGMGGYTSAFVAPLAPINPSVLIGMVVGGYIPARHMWAYLVGDLLGAVGGQFTVFGLYYEALRDFSLTKYNRSLFEVPQMALQCSAPPPHAGVATQMAGVFLQVALLIGGVNTIMDRRNFRVPVPAQPVLFGLLISILLTGFSHNAGGTMNVGMDLAGRIVASVVGWGGSVWTVGNYFFWVPLVMGPLGAVFGAIAYNVAIRPNLPREDEEPAAETKHEIAEL